MKIKRFGMCVAGAMLMVVILGPLSVLAEEATTFTGTVSYIQGQRLEIVLDNGEKIMVTTNQAIPASALGQRISGRYKPVADTNLLIDPSFNQ